MLEFLISHSLSRGDLGVCLVKGMNFISSVSSRYKYEEPCLALFTILRNKFHSEAPLFVKSL
jgi:hypothetical protein